MQMFKLLYTSDVHGNEEFYKRIVQRAEKDDIKAIAIGGDLCPRGGNTLEEWVEHQRKFIQGFLIPLFKNFKKKHKEKNVFLIMGNDDFRRNMDLFEKADEQEVFHAIHKKAVKLHQNVFICGYSIVNTTPFRIKDWEKDDFPYSEKPKMISHYMFRTVEEEKGTIEEDMKTISSLSNPQKTIYVMHAPPFNTNLDIIATKQHVGSEAIREFILKEKPLMTLHGHIHEGPEMSGSWMDSLGETICINVGTRYPEMKVNTAVIDVENVQNVQYEELDVNP